MVMVSLEVKFMRHGQVQVPAIAAFLLAALFGLPLPLPAAEPPPRPIQTILRHAAGRRSEQSL